MSKDRNNRGFLNFGILTIVAVYFLIFVGGLVRSTGSGMGCPDWPKCFGKWVPPVSVSDLPDNYKEIYTQKRISKNKRVVALLNSIGFHKTASRIEQHPGAYMETEFNSVHTWIEYINRLIGVVTGIFIVLLFIKSFAFFKSDPTTFFLSFLALFLVGFQGWLGSIVVSTNLLPFVITAHMALALILVMLLIYLIFRSQGFHFNKSKIYGSKSMLQLGLILLLIASFFQVILGTQVRETVDLLTLEFDRSLWIDHLGGIFKFHRSFSIAVLTLFLFLFFRIIKVVPTNHVLRNISFLTGGTLTLTIVSGIVLAYFDFPAFDQPLHLLFANLLVGVEFLLFMIIRKSEFVRKEVR